MPYHVLLALTITLEIPVIPTSAAIIGVIALLATYFLIRQDERSQGIFSRSELNYRLKVQTGMDLSKTYDSIAQEIHFSTPGPSPVTKWIRIVSVLVALLVVSASYVVGYRLDNHPFQIVCNISAGVLAILLVINLFTWLASLVDFSVSIDLKPTIGESAGSRAIREAFGKEPGRKDVGNALLDITLSILAGIICGLITVFVLNSVVK